LILIPAPKVNSGIVQSRNAKSSANGKMRRIGADETRTAWNINISRPADGTRPILIIVAKEGSQTINY